MSVKLPVLRNVPLSSDLGVDKWAVVLEIAAQSFGFERGPDGELVHRIGLGGPEGELVGVGGEGFLHFCDGGARLEEEYLLRKELLNLKLWEIGTGMRTYGSVSGLEAVETLLGRGPSLGWHDCLEDLLGHLPELVMLFLDQQDDAGGLGIE